jgi:hypothetical protein
MERRIYFPSGETPSVPPGGGAGGNAPVDRGKEVAAGSSGSVKAPGPLGKALQNTSGTKVQPQTSPSHGQLQRVVVIPPSGEPILLEVYKGPPQSSSDQLRALQETHRKGEEAMAAMDDPKTIVEQHFVGGEVKKAAADRSTVAGVRVVAGMWSLLLDLKGLIEKHPEFKG